CPRHLWLLRHVGIEDDRHLAILPVDPLQIVDQFPRTGSAAGSRVLRAFDSPAPDAGQAEGGEAVLDTGQRLLLALDDQQLLRGIREYRPYAGRDVQAVAAAERGFVLDRLAVAGARAIRLQTDKRESLLVPARITTEPGQGLPVGVKEREGEARSHRANGLG